MRSPHWPALLEYIELLRQSNIDAIRNITAGKEVTVEKVAMRAAQAGAILGNLDAFGMLPDVASEVITGYEAWLRDKKDQEGDI